MTMIYTATASSDWGGIYYDQKIEASTFGAAVAKAGRLAVQQSRKRPKQIVVRVTRVGRKV